MFRRSRSVQTVVSSLSTAAKVVRLIFHLNSLINVNRFGRSEGEGSEISKLLTMFVYRSHVSPSSGEELGAVYFVNGTLACCRERRLVPLLAGLLKN